ncbi:MAG TPA: histidinol dehydrogenase, partial [Terracidiphilus sp.]
MKLLMTAGRGAGRARETIAALEARGGTSLESVLPAVRRIVADVRRGGDYALLKYAKKFDGLGGADAIRIGEDEMAATWEACGAEIRAALTTAAQQIRGFAEMQMPQSWSSAPVAGLTTGQIVRPLGA